mmetsp:Transcript_18149/g.37793  ORF Transcript_18149/g.37793 Transcript_18149/m.37793 type:complete len:82 (-) Transcript_18149:1820-2065(-)
MSVVLDAVFLPSLPMRLLHVRLGVGHLVSLGLSLSMDFVSISLTISPFLGLASLILSGAVMRNDEPGCFWHQRQEMLKCKC